MLGILPKNHADSARIKIINFHIKNQPKIVQKAPLADYAYL